ncbi:MAG: hypothetical protein P8Y21_12470 [Gemmatimonadales bacterium]|jgi:hypothetical protein
MKRRKWELKGERMPRGRGLIGDAPERGAPRWTGLIARMKILCDYGHPEPLERVAAAMDTSSDPAFRSMADVIHLRAMEGRHALQVIEAGGFEFDFETGKIKLTQDRRRDGMVDMVFYAFEEIGGRDLDHPYDREVLALIRDRLSEYIDEGELTDDKIKSRLQQALRRSSPLV